MAATETATVHRYLDSDMETDGVPQGTLVATVATGYDSEKRTICFSLPDLVDPAMSAYLGDLGPELATIEVATINTELTWRFAPADSTEVPDVVARAEAKERADAELMTRPDIQAAFRTLRDAGVTVERLATVLSALSADDSGEVAP
jgi:hypothetical protein